MKPAIVGTALLSGVLGGGVGAATTAMTLGSPAAKAEERQKPSAPEVEADEAEGQSLNGAADDYAGVAVRMKSLERRVSLLTAALAKAGGPRPVDGANGDGNTPPEDALGEGGVADVASPVFHAAVRDILDQVDEEKRSERDARRAEFMERATNQWTDWLGSELRLTEDQKQDVAEVVRAHHDAMRALWERPEEERPTSRREWREQRNGLREQAEKKLREVLTPAQAASYEKLDEDDRLGGFRGGGGGGRSRGRNR